MKRNLSGKSASLAELVCAACQLIYDLRFNPPEEVRAIRDAIGRSLTMAGRYEWN